MSGFWLFDALIILLFLVVLLGVITLHFLISRGYQKENKMHYSRIADLQRLVEMELERSRYFSDQVDFLAKQKDHTQDQLDLIRLQVEAMKKGEK
ncbi:hypothetical protein ACFPIK_17450 [Algoriphagus aquatilis]|uniref:Phage shock protein B n=1 Tax=Algoriphagus aquatilis TaxID=490186 RepID=A0ABW0C311_9BACT